MLKEEKERVKFVANKGKLAADVRKLELSPFPTWLRIYAHDTVEFHLG